MTTKSKDDIQRLLHVFGDSIFDEFLPARLETHRSIHADPSQYTAHGHGENASILNNEKPVRFYSPGGAALVGYLTASRERVLISTALPSENHFVSKLLSLFNQNRPHATLDLSWSLNPCTSCQLTSRYYVQSSNGWTTALRVDHYHEPEHHATSLSSSEMQTPDLLLIFDQGNGFVREDTIGELSKNSYERIILYASIKNLSDYRALRPVSAQLLVIVNEMEALSLVGGDTSPATFPEGDLRDHIPLLHAITSSLRESFAATGFIVTFGSRPGQCVSFTRSEDNLKEWILRDHRCLLHKKNRNKEEPVPGTSSAFVSGLALEFMKKNTFAHSVAYGLQCALHMASSAIDLRGDWFGRVEDLPEGVTHPSPEILLTSVDSAEVELELDLLGRAQLLGHLPQSTSALPGYYSTIDFNERLTGLLTALDSYLARPRLRRPFNLLLSAQPGSGKSFLVESLSRELSQRSERAGRGADLHPFLETNLTLTEASGGLDVFLEKLYGDIRDARALGRIPVVLLDELDAFEDTASTRAPDVSMGAVFRRMLVPMWDGSFVLRGRNRRLGGFILVLVVSSSNFIQKLDQPGKSRDFGSRIDVALSLPEPNKGSPELYESQIRVAMGMLQKHHGHAVREVELSVLDTIGKGVFERRNRGIDQLLMLSSSPSDGVFRLNNLPAESILNEQVFQNLDRGAAVSRFGSTAIKVSI